MNTHFGAIRNSRSMGVGTLRKAGATEITSGGIQKHFKKTEPHEAVFELIWNGFDAGSVSVDVLVEINEMGSPEQIVVLDSGCGIDFEVIEQNFGRFNESSKVGDASQHGSHGRGRLAFHRLAHNATWHTKTKSGQAVISVSNDDLKNWNLEVLEEGRAHGRVSTDTGTSVTLENFYGNVPDPERMQTSLSHEFGWYLALNKGKSLRYAGTAVVVPAHDHWVREVEIDDFNFCVNVVRWNERPTGEKSYIYFVSSDGRPVHKTLSSLNNKKDFFSSVIVSSVWFDSFDKTGGLFRSDHSVDSDVWKKLLKNLDDFSKDVYDEFLRGHAERQISKYEDAGEFPVVIGQDENYRSWRRSNIKKIATAIYLADPGVFSALSSKQRKIIFALLDRLSISNENDAIFDVIQGVLGLGGEDLATLGGILKQTSLQNIVATIELLQRRSGAIHSLRTLMNDHYKDVRETPDLQKVIENHTWLFGPNYEILGAEEDTFTKIARSLRDSVKGVNGVDESDLADGVIVDGANRQVDLFLARRLPQRTMEGENFYRCVIVEIKRPCISLNKKHLRQLEDYAEIIAKHPEFSSNRLRFELILIGRKISSADTHISSRLEGMKGRGEFGLISDAGSIKQYVMDWFSLLDSHDLVHASLLERLQIKRDELSKNKEELLDELQH